METKVSVLLTLIFMVLGFHSTGGCFEAAVKVSNQIVNIFKAN